MCPSKICYLTILPFCCGFLVYMSFLGGSVVKKLPANAGDTEGEGSVLGLGRPPGGGHGNPLQYSCLGNPMDRGAWWATVHGVAENQTGLSN